MPLPFKKRILKTLTYRISTNVIIQLLLFLVFHRVELNLVIGILEVVRGAWYFIHEEIWERWGK